MRITKFLIIAAIATMAMSCAHNFEATPTQEAEIGFNTWGEQLTKARAQGASTFEVNDHFYVYGCKTVTEEQNTVNKVVFQNTEVTKSSSNPETWNYSPKRFWDGNASQYTFFAISVTGEDTNPTSNHATCATTGQFSGSGITFSGSDKDILVAKKEVIAKGNDNFNNHHSVDLDFYHIGSLVDLKVKKASTLTGSTVAITAVSLINVKNQGGFSITYNNQTNLPEAGWQAGNSTATYTNASGVGETVELPTDVPVHANATTGAALISNLIVMPQDLLAQTQQLQISYTITTPIDNETNDVITVTNATIDLNQFDQTDFDQNPTNNNSEPFITSWAQGKHYIYYLTIDANAISFTAEIIDWTPVNGYHYLVN